MSDKTEKALKIFHAAPDFYNCAQAVAASCGREDLLDEMKRCGGGKAPGGTCGALHAAMQILPEEKRASAFKNFVAINGASTCAELKGKSRVPCMKCVETAVSIVEKNLG